MEYLYFFLFHFRFIVIGFLTKIGRMTSREIRHEESYSSSSNVVRTLHPSRPLSPPHKNIEFNNNNLGECPLVFHFSHLNQTIFRLFVPSSFPYLWLKMLKISYFQVIILQMWLVHLLKIYCRGWIVRPFTFHLTTVVSD